MLEIRSSFKKVVATAICLAGSMTLFAQDIIVLKTGEKIRSVVREVETDYVRYKHFKDQEGLTYRLKKSAISLIRYEDGSRDVFDNASARVEGSQQNDRQREIIYSDYRRPVSGEAYTERYDDIYRNKIYLGVGGGFDYGGLVGGKLEYLPTKYIGLFAGAGYNLLSVGWNVGGTLKILPNRKVSPNLMLMYGYNAVIVGTDSYSEQYETTSYGVTAGMNLDIKVGKNNKISIGLFVPFRSSDFKEIHEYAKNDPNMSLTKLFPVTFSAGFNFGF